MQDHDFETLVKEGNVGFFQSCEVTQLFILRKKDKAVINFYILASIEEKPIEGHKPIFLGKPIKLNDEYSLGIQRYWLSLDEIKSTFYHFNQNKKWLFGLDDTLLLGKMTKIAKQFVPGNDSQRLSRVLKNNFHNGSYIIEFFDESKRSPELLTLLENLKLLNQVSETIKKVVPFDLSLVRDRIGNIVFQFPVRLFNVDSRAKKDWTGLFLNFHWHPRLPQGKSCLINVHSTMDKNYMGGALVHYNGQNNQEIITGSIEQISHVKIWSEEPNLLLMVFDGTYLRGMSLHTGIGSHEPRIFQIGTDKQEVSMTSKGMRSGDSDEVTYTTYIHSTLYEAEKEHLEQTLSFKQYFKGKIQEAFTDLRTLIGRNDSSGAYLWDPYLRSNDLLKTLYFSETMGTTLKAIGAIDGASKTVYEQKGVTAAEIIAREAAVLDNPVHNNYGLNLEFRMQHSAHGWDFHDRFLIFPGNLHKRPKAYSLGTSVNSFGNSHHILQEVSHPQRVIDAFDQLWDQLNHQDCLVWKFPKKL